MLTAVAFLILIPALITQLAARGFTVPFSIIRRGPVDAVFAPMPCVRTTFLLPVSHLVLPPRLSDSRYCTPAQASCAEKIRNVHEFLSALLIICVAYSPIWVIIQRISWRDFRISSRWRAGDVSRFPPDSTYARIASLIAWETLMCFLSAISSSFFINSTSSLIPVCLVIFLLSNDLALTPRKIKKIPGAVDFVCFMGNNV